MMSISNIYYMPKLIEKNFKIEFVVARVCFFLIETTKEL